MLTILILIGPGRTGALETLGPTDHKLRFERAHDAVTILVTAPGTRAPGEESSAAVKIITPDDIGIRIGSSRTDGVNRDGRLVGDQLGSSDHGDDDRSEGHTVEEQLLHTTPYLSGTTDS